MAYGSVHGRRPIERASKISHAEVINNPVVQEFLTHCMIPNPPDLGSIDALITPIPEPDQRRFKVVIAIDGSYREVPVQDRFPSATVTFFTFGPLLLRLQDLADLDASPFLAPEDMARLKKIQRYTFVLPTRNVALQGRTLRRSVRDSLHQFVSQTTPDEPPLIDALRWLLLRQWNSLAPGTWTLPQCPNEDCQHTNILLTTDSPNAGTCPVCRGPIYLIDALRLHEAVDEDHGAGGILAYVMTTLEQLALVHVVKLIWTIRRQTLREVLFIKDGPLAFFGQTAPLCTPMKELASFMHAQPDQEGAPGSKTCLLNVVGLEKSGPFVDHATQVSDRLRPSTALILNNDYIYRYVIPGDPTTSHPYGGNTYWGNKLIFKAKDGNVYVATIPTGESIRSPTLTDFPNIAEILDAVGKLRCSMYDNALVPIALANKLVSLSDFPSSRILESFARGGFARI